MVISRQNGIGDWKPVMAWGAAGLCVGLLAVAGCVSEERLY